LEQSVQQGQKIYRQVWFIDNRHVWHQNEVWRILVILSVTVIVWHSSRQT
jgi:hypothetical protein